MKTEEVSLRIVNFIEKINDAIFPLNTLSNRFKNATIKFYIQQNKNRVCNAINMFSDTNGEIDIDDLINCLESTMLDDGCIKIDIQKLAKDYIPNKNEYIEAFLPEKIIILKREDIKTIFGI